MFLILCSCIPTNNMLRFFWNCIKLALICKFSANPTGPDGNRCFINNKWCIFICLNKVQLDWMWLWYEHSAHLQPESRKNTVFSHCSVPIKPLYLEWNQFQSSWGLGCCSWVQLVWVLCRFLMYGSSSCLNTMQMIEFTFEFYIFAGEVLRYVLNFLLSSFPFSLPFLSLQCISQH